MRRLALAAAVALTALTGCDNVSLEPRFKGVPRFGEQPRNDPWDALKAGPQDAQAKLDELKKSAESQLRALEAEIDRLEKKTAEKTDQADQSYQATVKRLEARKRTLEEQLHASARSGEAALEKLGKAIDEAISEAKNVAR